MGPEEEGDRFACHPFHLSVKHSCHLSIDIASLCQEDQPNKRAKAFQGWDRVEWPGPCEACHELMKWPCQFTLPPSVCIAPLAGSTISCDDHVQTDNRQIRKQSIQDRAGPKRGTPLWPSLPLYMPCKEAQSGICIEAPTWLTKIRKDTCVAEEAL